MSPQGTPPGEHATSLHAAPNGSQVPQLSLQQYSPEAHVLSPQVTGPLHTGWFGVHWPVGLQKRTMSEPAHCGSCGSQSVHGAPQTLPAHGSYTAACAAGSASASAGHAEA